MKNRWFVDASDPGAAKTSATPMIGYDCITIFMWRKASVYTPR